MNFIEMAEKSAFSFSRFSEFYNKHKLKVQIKYAKQIF